MSSDLLWRPFRIPSMRSMLSEEMVGDEGQVHWQTTSVSVVETDRGEEVEVEAVEDDGEDDSDKREVSRTRSRVVMAVASTGSAVAILAKTGIVQSSIFFLCSVQ